MGSLNDIIFKKKKVFNVIHLNGRTGYVMEEVPGTLFQDEIDNKPDKLEYHAGLLGKNS